MMMMGYRRLAGMSIADIPHQKIFVELVNKGTSSLIHLESWEARGVGKLDEWVWGAVVVVVTLMTCMVEPSCWCMGGVAYSYS